MAAIKIHHWLTREDLMLNLHPILAIKRFVGVIVSTVVTIVKFFAAALTEPDGNGGKASFARVMGTYVTIRIVESEIRGGTVSPNLMTIFWVLVGYGMLSKVLSQMSPAVLDVAKSFLIKAGVQVKIPEVPNGSPS
jgi:hypothetical protein